MNATLTQTPVMTTLNGKSAFPESHPLALGAGGASRPKMVRHFLDKADFVLGIGTRFTRSFYITPVPDDKVMAQITHDSGDIGKDYQIVYGAVGDAKLVLQQMIAVVKDTLGEHGRRGETTIATEVAAVKEAFMRSGCRD